MLDVWELIDNVTTLVCDTTASSNGWRCGAAKLLEGLMGKKLFYHACRHHIYELVIKPVYQQIFGSATIGPENVLFKEFKSALSSIDTTQDIKTLELDPSNKWLEQRAKEVTEELTQLLSRELERERINHTVLIRDDYKESADNTLVLLNAVSQHNATIRKPGAVHSARWMSQVLYCQKMYMWSQQMSYDDILIAKLRGINLFLALFYVPAWLSSSIGSNAGINDFLFLENMSQYEKFDSAVAQAASKKLARHRWYPEEETVVYVLLSDHPAITNGDKREMAQRLLNVPKPESFRTGLPVCKRPLTPSTKLSDLLGPES